MYDDSLYIIFNSLAYNSPLLGIGQSRHLCAHMDILTKTNIDVCLSQDVYINVFLQKNIMYKLCLAWVRWCSMVEY